MTTEEIQAMLDGLQRPNQTYNMWAVAGAAVPSAILGVDAFIKNRKAKTDLKKQQGYVDTLMKNYMETPIYNPYDNLSVATQANQIKMEETDKALANTLDTLRAQGASAGGATALAQAALRSKAGIAADIEKQEVGNERLKAQGEIMVQNAEMQRRGQQMDYEQSKADQLRMEQFAYGERAADMAGALGSLGLQAARGLGSNRNKRQKLNNNQQDETFMDDANMRNRAAQQEIERDYQERMEKSLIDNTDGDSLTLADEIFDTNMDNTNFTANTSNAANQSGLDQVAGMQLMDPGNSPSLNLNQSVFDPSKSVGYVIRTSDREKIPYEQLPIHPSGEGRDMTGFSQLYTYK